MMKQVMVKAWEIAREGVKKFGGKVKEYLSEALRMAWAIVKDEAGHIIIEVSQGSRKHKSYVAEIVGLDEKYGFKRNFISEEHDEKYVKVAKLENGKVYEVQDAGDRKYVKVENDEVIEITKDEAVEAVKTDVDELIERVKAFCLDAWKKDKETLVKHFGTYSVYENSVLNRYNIRGMNEETKKEFVKALEAKGY